MEAQKRAEHAAAEAKWHAEQAIEKAENAIHLLWKSYTSEYPLTETAKAEALLAQVAADKAEEYQKEAEEAAKEADTEESAECYQRAELAAILARAAANYATETIQDDAEAEEIVNQMFNHKNQDQ